MNPTSPLERPAPDPTPEPEPIPALDKFVTMMFLSGVALFGLILLWDIMRALFR